MRADVVIDPDADTADEIMELTEASGADEVYQMSGGDLIVLGCTIGEGAALAGSTLAEIGASYEPDWSFLFGALTRDGETVIPRGDQRLEVGDHVRVLTSRRSRNEILELLGAAHRRAKRVMVLGGGAVGSRVAERLEQAGSDVVLVEHDIDRARVLAERLPRITVVRGDIEDTDMLSEESIDDKDLVIAATGDDAANVSGVCVRGHGPRHLHRGGHPSLEPAPARSSVRHRRCAQSAHRIGQCGAAPRAWRDGVGCDIPRE